MAIGMAIWSMPECVFHPTRLVHGLAAVLLLATKHRYPTTQFGNETNTLWLFNIAMENGPFIDGLPINSMVIFHGYVK